MNKEITIEEVQALASEILAVDPAKKYILVFDETVAPDAVREISRACESMGIDCLILTGPPGALKVFEISQ